ncbi:N-6 DNA methylase [Patescibacteria group bacterium]|nr:N-6 DNA methylase [Patescibacteria group bacterium]
MNLQQKYDREDFLSFLKNFVPNFKADVRHVNGNSLQVTKEVHLLGNCEALDLEIFEVTHSSTADARVTLSMDGFRIMKNSATYRALIVYRSEKDDDWRLSLMTATPNANEQGKVVQSLSNPRRFSFFLGPNAKVNTPNQFLIKQGPVKDFVDLQKRFSLEVVNKEFYKEISEKFIELVGGTSSAGKKKKVYEPLLKLPAIAEKSQVSLEFAVRLIGRIIFCWFLREKKGSNGSPLMPKSLLSLEAIANHADYYHNVLESIFFEILNKEVKARTEAYSNEPFSFIPYLNGGLFSPHEDDYYKRRHGEQSLYHNTLIIPDDWFIDFFKILETYNFTIDENTSFDEELSIDPEMLGRIFENLLAEINPETGESARKCTGSYYTPRVIVDYMVDESLLLYLKKQTNIEESKLRAIISYDLNDDLEHPLNDDEKQKTIDALGKLKLLDPACGSGAFPIGALQKIVFILQQIDQDGQLWLKTQLKSAPLEIRRVIEREFVHKNFDYIRKLGVIRENIYGVDIQPIATEISRLRCFLTLVVDERVDETLENRGIEPLPNLDFKFVTANSLIPLPSGEQTTLFKDQAGIEQLQDLRDQFFNATNNERHQLKDEFKEIQKAMLLRMIENGGGDELTQKLSAWDPFSNKPSAWFDPEWMFGINNGFDVVIGNPPYVSYGLRGGQKMSSEDKELTRRLFPNSAEYKISLYALFMDKALQFTKDEGGVQTFIVPDSFLLGRYFSKIRSYILKNNYIHKLLLFHYGVFQATVGLSVVYIFQKAKNIDPKHNLSVITPKAPDDLINNKANSFTYAQAYFNSTKYNRFRLFFDSTTKDLISKIENQSIELGSIYIGRTGVRSKIGQKNIISNEKKADTYQKGIISGGQITRYYIKYDGDFINIDPTLLNGGGWDYDVIHNPKILLRQTSDSLIASIDTENYYHLNNVHSFTPKDGTNVELEYILAILNSKLMNFFYQKTTLEVGRAMAQTDIETVESLPIRLSDKETRQKIAQLVQKILSEKRTKPDANVAADEKSIDDTVYRLYAINADEKKFIEENVKF